MLAKAIGPLLGIVVLAVFWAGSAHGGEGTELYGRSYWSAGDTLWVDSSGDTWEVLGDQVTIAPATWVTATGVDSLVADLGYGVEFVGPSGAYIDLAIPDTSDAVEVLTTCEGDGRIADAWANTRAELAAAPSDLYYSEHIGWWRQWNLRRINAEEAWSIETGDTSVVIAVLDTGIELEHDDLKGNLWINWAEYYGASGVNDDSLSNDYVDDIYGINVDDENGDVGEVGGHGTKVSGLVAAQTNNNGTGIAGLAGGWYDESWTVGDRGSGCLILTAASPSMNSVNLRKGLLYAASEGADVASMSFDTAETDDWKSAIETAVDSGMVLVAAAGNHNEEPVKFPARCRDVIAVGASDYLDHDCFYQSSGGSLEVVAPSAACVLIAHQCDDCSGYYSGDYLCDSCVCDSLFMWTTGEDGVSNAYGFFGGTSAATPQVSALAGLLLSYDNTLTRNEVRQLIRSSAQDGIGDDEDLQGRDAHYGFGRIDAYTALFLARGGGATTSDLRLCYDVEFDRDVKVSAGHTLTILPGVTVDFAANSDVANLGVDSSRCELIVEGTLLAQGTDADTLVTFTSSGSSAGDWYGIRTPADAGAIALAYCGIENAYKGISVDNPDSLKLAELQIENCASHGIYCEGCDSSAGLDPCTITDPGLVGVEARDCTGMTLSGHTITEATEYGIKCYDVAGMTVSDNSILGDANSEDFIGIYYKPAAGDSTYAITENTVQRCGSRGISVEGGGATTATIGSNTVSDQGYGRGTVGIHLNKSRAKVRENVSEKKVNGVVALVGMASPKWIPDLGRNVSGEHGYNQWVDDSVWYVWAGITGPDSLLKAERNWHGTATPDPNKFTNSVDWRPVLKEAPARGGDPSDPQHGEAPDWVLAQNWPNPFSPATNIRYGIPVAGDVNLRIYNTAGQVVRMLVDERREAGSHGELWDGCDDGGRRLASGVYFARLLVDGEIRVRKLALLK